MQSCRNTKIGIKKCTKKQTKKQRWGSYPAICLGYLRHVCTCCTLSPSFVLCFVPSWSGRKPCWAKSQVPDLWLVESGGANCDSLRVQLLQERRYRGCSSRPSRRLVQNSHTKAILKPMAAFLLSFHFFPPYHYFLMSLINWNLKAASWASSSPPGVNALCEVQSLFGCKSGSVWAGFHRNIGFF